MDNTDVSPAAFMISNPYNDIIGNRAAGSDFYGFWFSSEKILTGPTAVSDICPQGYQLGSISDNTVHSSTWYGMRI